MSHPDDDAQARRGGADGRRARKKSPGRKAAWTLQSPSRGGQEPGQTEDPAAPRLKRRRKRKRGRKVFAAADTVRDGTGASGEAVRPAGAPGPVTQRPQGVRLFRPSAGRSHDDAEPNGLPPAYAALDLGTNNCRLLVAVPGRHGRFRVIDAFSRIVRLGEGLTTTGRLGEAAMDRAVEALKICGDKLRSRPIRRARLVATEACRVAANGNEFLTRVRREAGLELEIIDRRTEARLAVSGCGPLVERDTDAVVLFDIGGGSSEIALVDLSRRRSSRLANHIVSWTSLPIGVVSLAERFGGRHVTRDLFEAMVSDVSRMIEGFEGRHRLNHHLNGARFHLLGTSGTVTTLAGVHLGLERYDRRQVDGLWLDDRHVDEMIDRLLSWDFEQRVANPCIGADRADLVLGGCAILQAIRGAWPSRRLRVADRGLREGILSELMAEERAMRHRQGANVQ